MTFNLCRLWLLPGTLPQWFSQNWMMQYHCFPERSFGVERSCRSCSCCFEYSSRGVPSGSWSVSRLGTFQNRQKGKAKRPDSMRTQWRTFSIDPPAFIFRRFDHVSATITFLRKTRFTVELKKNVTQFVHPRRQTFLGKRHGDMLDSRWAIILPIFSIRKIGEEAI